MRPGGPQRPAGPGGGHAARGGAGPERAHAGARSQVKGSGPMDCKEHETCVVTRAPPGGRVRVGKEACAARRAYAGLDPGLDLKPVAQAREETLKSKAIPRSHIL